MNNFKTYPVLLAEDNKSDIIFLQNAVQTLGVSVSIYTVIDGQEAVRYLLGEGQYADREHYPEPLLLITDVTMPIMNGLQLLAWVKQESKFKDLPVFVMSTSEEPEVLNQVITLGGSAYFVKTSNMNILREFVKQIVSFLPEIYQGS